MTYEELVKNANEAAQLINADIIRDHAAIEIDIEGEGEGAFYIELDEGKAVVEPYEYYNKDCRIRTTADVLRELLAGNLDLNTAINTSRLRLEGNRNKFAYLAEIIKEAVAEKASKVADQKKKETKKAADTVKPEKTADTEKPAKKTAAKKTATAKKAEVKEPAAEAEKPAKKAAAKKTTTAKKADTTAEKKTTKKAAAKA